MTVENKMPDDSYISKCPKCDMYIQIREYYSEECNETNAYGTCNLCGYDVKENNNRLKQWRKIVKVLDLTRVMCFIDTVRIYENHSMIFCGKKEDVPKGLLRKEVYQAFCPDTYTINITID